MGVGDPRARSSAQTLGTASTVTQLHKSSWLGPLWKSHRPWPDVAQLRQERERTPDRCHAMGRARQREDRCDEDRASNGDMLERFFDVFDGSFNHEELRAPESAYVGEKLEGHEANNEARSHRRV